MPRPRVCLLAALAAASCAVLIPAALSPADAQVSRHRPAAPPIADRAAVSGAPARLTLPPPTGRYQVGTVSLDLVDRSRPNPWAASPPYRELMVSLWYPAGHARRYPLAPQMLPAAAAHFGSPAGAGSQLYGIPPGSVDWAATLTSGHQGAPLARHRRRLPVVLFSPGAEDPRTWETTLVQDLASRGYIVVTIDHTYDSSEVEFPGGRVVGTLWPEWFARAQHDFFPLAKKILAVRIADTRFVLDELMALDAGGNPDAEGRPLPRGLSGALDMRHAGMFGVSLGGIITPETMYEDPRIRAGIDIGGTVESPLIPHALRLWPVAQHGLGRPFMFMGDPRTDHNSVPSWQALWTRSPGWHADLTLKGASGENSYKDLVPLAPQIARQLGLPESFVTGAIGTIDPARAIAAEEAYVSAFFGRWLRGLPGHLLDGPSPRYPGIAFIR